MRRLRERDLLVRVATYVRGKGYTTQAIELRFYEYKIDLYAFSKRTGKTLAIELKLTKWKRALQQALIYQLCSDFVFIALPLRVVDHVDPTLLRAHGIGLIAVCSNNCRTIVEAERSREVRQHYRVPYIRMLKGARNGRR